jgi:hypothetical protein
MGKVAAFSYGRTQAQKDTEEGILLNHHFTTVLKQDDRNIELPGKC